MNWKELKELINSKDPICGLDEEINPDNMEIEFCTSDENKLTLLSIYEADGKVLIDIGTGEE